MQNQTFRQEALFQGFPNLGINPIALAAQSLILKLLMPDRHLSPNIKAGVENSFTDGYNTSLWIK
jgi:hypothetical protein